MTKAGSDDDATAFPEDEPHTVNGKHGAQNATDNPDRALLNDRRIAPAHERPRREAEGAKHRNDDEHHVEGLEGHGNGETRETA